MPYRTGQSENLATFLLLRKNPRKPIELAETRLIFARRPTDDQINSRDICGGNSAGPKDP
jgi:hypothetical protein